MSGQALGATHGSSLGAPAGCELTGRQEHPLHRPENKTPPWARPASEALPPPPPHQVNRETTSSGVGAQSWESTLSADDTFAR